MTARLQAVPDTEDVEETTSELVLLAAPALADLLGISTGRIYQMRHDGLLPPVIKIGTLIRWDRADIYAWLDSMKES
ncbi:helix-turn-helix domain-containing protein [Gordonia sp. PDNC005]|uniref:helix-turn-helix transcriptional regulator n=1 Tax=Gordonia sp. PDNC005 TaxID=2811424 RepID=UPI001964A338|nr:helix-turn-helix domain-containing protein [Gordonia sp. PDNC005]QRY62700.1 helix-turn-helix domain-containing protein [Gordonia sp. PDNC005]